jgi:peptide/nickel transport system substrate-binding protein
MGSGSEGWIDDMAMSEDIKLDFHGVGESIILYLNTRMKPLDDIRVRKAIAYALDRRNFIETSNKLLVKKIYSLVPEQLLPGGLAREDAARLDLLFSKNLEKARALMAEAGFSDGFTLDLVSSEKRLYQSCYQSLAGQLEKIGIHCRIRTVSHSDMHRIIRKDPRPLVIYVSWRPNAQIYLNRSFHSDSIVVTGRKPSTNFSHYSRVDKLIEDARLEIDPGKQVNLWEQSQIRILSDVAAYPIMFTRQVYARRPYVDYGHPLSSTMALYPQFTENTRIIKPLKTGGQ